LQEEIKELTDIHIDMELPIAERMEKYMDEIGNPYCFTVNGTAVNIRFSDTNKTLTESLYQYFTHKNEDENELL